MSVLRELAEGYREAAALLRLGIEDTQKELETMDDPLEAFQLRRKLQDMRLALRQARDLRRLCETYYEREQDPAYSCVRMRAGNILAKYQEEKK